MFVWLERNGVPVFLNDIKADEHDYPAAAKLPPPSIEALSRNLSLVC